MSNGEPTEVTFVGGVPVEQTESLDSSLEVDEREAAKKAVREAIEKAGKDSAEDAKSDRGKDPYKPPGTTREPSEKDSSKETPERGPDGKFLPKEGSEKTKEPKEPVKEEPEEDIDLDKASVKQLFKQREIVAAMKREAKDEISKERQEFLREKEATAREWEKIQRAQEEVRKQHESFQRLRQDPARAIREIGYDPEKFILDLAQEGTPEGAARRKQQEIDDQLAEIKAWRKSQEQEVVTRQQRAQEEHQRQYREHATQTFLNKAFNEEKYPHVANFYKGDERSLIAVGDATAADYRQLSGGKEGSYEDILDYLEDNLATRTKTWYSKGTVKQEKIVEPKVPPKSKGKSLSPDNTGERRSLHAKDLRDLNAEERIEAARQAVSVALSASRNDD